jgi:hypothetical protein
MASKIKVDQLETVDGTGNITVNQPLSGSGAGLTSLPAANLTGVIPAANLGTGTASSTTFLNGSGAYSEAGGGAWTVINSTSISSVSAVNFTSGISSTYEYYMLVGSNVILNTPGGISVRLSSDAGSSWHSSSNNYAYQSYIQNSTTFNGYQVDHNYNTGYTTQFDITRGIEAGTNLPTNFTVEFWNLSQSATHKPMMSKTNVSVVAGTPVNGTSLGLLKLNNAINGIQVLADGGAPTLVSGRITLYGIKHT